jgi:MEMO1 family protein
MVLRRAALAGTWYPDGEARCRAALEESLPVTPDCLDARVFGGLVPHAGWIYSWPTAARTLAALGSPSPATIVLFGFSHRMALDTSAVSTMDAWETPLGPLAVDREIADRLLSEAGDLLIPSDRAHPAGENSIEVILPLLKGLHPDATFVPIAVAPGAQALELGRLVGRSLLNEARRVAVIGSTDLTHYGANHYGFAPQGTGRAAHRWSKETNDRSFLDHILALDPAAALADARKNRNACGASAAAATTAAAMELGARDAVLLDHVTSWEVGGERGEPTDFVGYASVVFTDQD